MFHQQLILQVFCIYLKKTKAPFFSGGTLNDIDKSANMAGIHYLTLFVTLGFQLVSGMVTGEGDKPTIPSCICGVFMSGQIKGKKPQNPPIVTHDMEDEFPCSSVGVKKCSSKCLETAYLFVKNCNGSWVNTNMSAGREYCCKDGAFYKCPSGFA